MLQPWWWPPAPLLIALSCQGRCEQKTLDNAEIVRRDLEGVAGWAAVLVLDQTVRRIPTAVGPWTCGVLPEVSTQWALHRQAALNWLARASKSTGGVRPWVSPGTGSRGRCAFAMSP